MKYKYSYCSGLTSITIPNSVTFIGKSAFFSCSGLTSLIVEIVNPLKISSETFDGCYNATLYVAPGSKAKYEAADYWKNFKQIVEKEKCATPTIKYIGGKLKFECETEGVEFVYSITTPANRIIQTSYYIEIPHTNALFVYAMKDGYLDSDVAKAYFDVRGIQGDVNQDGKVTITDAVSVVNLILSPPAY